MPRAPRLLPLLLLLAAAAPSNRPAAALIEQLNDADPAVRDHAEAELRRLGPAAVPELADAAHDPRPTVAEAAAALLMRRDWSAPGDADAVARTLRRYGELPPDDRADRLRTIVQRGLPRYRAVVLRVLSADPVDAVAWATLFDVNPPDAAWLAELRKPGVALDRPAVRLLLARCTEFNGEHALTLDLCRKLLDAERQRPTTSGRLLFWPVEVLRFADRRAGRYAEAAGYLHDQLARADDQATSQPELLGELFDLHARGGPLPGFAADLRAAGNDADGRAGLTLGVLARRLGYPVAADALTAAATDDNPDEADADRADRYREAGDFLADLNQSAAAESLYRRLVALDTPTTRMKTPAGYQRLSLLYARQDRFQDAGDALQRALDRQNGLTLDRITAPFGPWQLEDEQATVYWDYLQAARARGDATEVARQALAIVASGSTDSNFFLDVLPAIEPVVPREQVDAYFDRVFKPAVAHVETAAENPTDLNDLAWLCARAGRRLDEATKWAVRAVTLAPEQSAFLDTLAEVRFRTGHPAEAAELEQHALANLPDDEEFMRGQLARFQAAAATQPATH